MPDLTALVFVAVLSSVAAVHDGPAPPRCVQATSADLAQVLPRVSAYLRTYLLAFSNVVAEEEYDQQVENTLRTEFSNGTFHLSRKLRSELLLVRLDGPGVWVPFRDVMAVDGKPVRERRERIQRLLIEDRVKTLRDSQRLADESARYDLGSIYRTVNMPTLALVFLMPQHLSNFIFTPGPDEVVGEVTATRIDYQETGHPTVVRHAKFQTDMPSHGSLWVDGPSGRIIKTRVVTTDGKLRMEATVTYRPEDRLGIWVPAVMTELYRQKDETITCTATYQNFKRFAVATDEVVKPPND